MNVCVNGNMFSSEQALLKIDNRSYKWGDGLFETMKVWRGNILLSNLHFDRLFSSLKLLEIECSENFTRSVIHEKVLELCGLNSVLHSARIRLAVFRQEDNTSGYSIETMPLNDGINKWNEVGQQLCLYPYARKAIDAFSNIKSASFLSYVMASRYAAAESFDDAVVLNSFNLLCDTSKANLFLIKEKKIITPALHQGCVNGVVRRLLIEELPTLGFTVVQTEVSENDLINADEVFLTNAIQFIQWVKRYKRREYGFTTTKEIHNFISPAIFNTGSL